jgi:hypothetical protein
MRHRLGTIPCELDGQKGWSYDFKTFDNGLARRQTRVVPRNHFSILSRRERCIPCRRQCEQAVLQKRRVLTPAAEQFHPSQSPRRPRRK